MPTADTDLLLERVAHFLELSDTAWERALAMRDDDLIDTGSNTTLRLAARVYHADNYDTPTRIELSEDGERFDMYDYHNGPSDRPVFVEVLTPSGRAFHGWVDAVTRRVVTT